jgi:hypothetical protein
MCAASTAITMADAFTRHGRLGEAPAAAAGMLRVLARAAGLPN